MLFLGGCAFELAERPAPEDGGGVELDAAYGPDAVGLDVAAASSSDAGRDAALAALDAPARPDATAQDAAVPGPPLPTRRAGLWLSPWALDRRSPAQWAADIAGVSYASAAPTRAIVVLSICGAASEGISQCRFPRPASVPAYEHVSFDATDHVGPILDELDRRGDIDVILDVEPMQAHVSELMHVAMEAFGARPSVVGFTPDWEWIHGDGDRGAHLEGWARELEGHRPGLELHLISWEASVFGPHREDGFSFGYDGQSFDPGRSQTPESNLAAQLRTFAGWSDAFVGHHTGWYWGYATDGWWTTHFTRDAASLRALQDEYLALAPDATLLLATEDPFFDVIETILPAAPMWER